MKKYFISLFLLALFFVGGGSTTLLACVCDGSDSVEAAFNKADSVFSGVFVSAEYRKGIVNQFQEMQAEAYGMKIDYQVLVLKFQVIHRWKGASAREVILVTSQTRAADGMESISDCDYVFEKGRKYLIYAYGKPDELATSACSRTAELKRARKDLRVLGKDY
jgi:hypothetical protein